MNPFFESLESRELFSAAVPHAAPAASQGPAVHAAAVSTIPRIVGRYTGTLSIPAVGHLKSVVLNITKQSGSKFTGKLTSGGVVINASGTVTAKRKVTLHLLGVHPGGAINGNGTATLDAAGKHLNVSMSFASGGQTVPGTLTLTKG